MSASSSKQTISKDQPQKKSQKSASRKRKAKESNLELVSTPGLQSEPDSIWEHNTPWNWTSLADPCSNKIPPVFTRDANYFFSLVGSSVQIHSTTTGLVVSTLTAPPSDGRSDANVLTSAVVNPHNPFQLITATLDGRLLIWDFVNGTLLQTINVGQAIHRICAHEKLKGSVFVAASLPQGKSNEIDAIILRVSLKSSDSSGKPTEKKVVGKLRFPTGLSISSNGAWLVATAAHKVYIAKMSDLSTGFTKYVSPERLTCLAFHPFEDYFASGDAKGVVRLWYCLNEDLAVNVRNVEKRTQTRPLHWHAHAVSSLAFSTNGAYLLSGGEEAVLVIWQLHTGKKEFVPRVGAPISTISVTKSLRSGEEEYLLGLADATYAFVSSTNLKISRSYSRLKVDSYGPSSKSRSVPLAIHSLTSTLVLPSSHPSSLQIYSPVSSTLLSELEVSPSNRVSRREDKPIIPSCVEKVVISSSGSWMATVDCRVGDVDFHPEVFLKFWSWSRKTSDWILNTRIDRPHGTHNVSDMSFNPDIWECGTPLLVSVGEDTRIKIWRLRSMPGTETSLWVSHATFDFRSELPRSISWSSDSSIFAVAVGPHIILYDPVTKSPRHTLTVPNSPAIQFVHFINGRPGYLLSSSSRNLVMWNIVDCQVSWQSTLPLQIDKVVPHPREAGFAVFHSTVKEDHQSKVSIFQASSSIPSSVFTLPFPLRNVTFNTFQTSSGFSVYGITQSWKAVLMGASSWATNEGPSSTGISIDHQPQKRTLFQDIFGASAFAPDPQIYEPSISTLSQKETAHPMSDIPAYLTPSFDTFFDPFIRKFLIARDLGGDDEAEQENVVDEDYTTMEKGDVMTITQRPSRLPNPGELEAFTKLFRSSCMTDGTRSTIPKINGKVNNLKLPDMNDSQRSPSLSPIPIKVRPAIPREMNDSSTSLDPSQLSVSLTLNNKKRKKAYS